MPYPPNYARDDVMRAANDVAASASSSAYTIASFAGMSSGNTARQYAQTVAQNALSNIESTAISYAMAGANAAVQAFRGSEVGAAAQTVAALARRADAVAGMTQGIFADAQEAGAVAAGEVVDGYRDVADGLTEEVSPQIPIDPPFGRSTPCNQNLINLEPVLSHNLNGSIDRMCGLSSRSTVRL
jgi:hypothetical protein